VNLPMARPGSTRFTRQSVKLFVLMMFAFILLLFTLQSARAQTSPSDQSPANDDILFLSQREGFWKTYLMSADGSNQRLVTKQLNFPRSLIQEYAAAFSPDRTQVVIAIIKTDASTSTSEHRLYRVGSDGKGLKLLWRGTSDYLNPVWSSTGDQILFSGYEADTGSDLYVINADGSNLKRLTEDSLEGLDFQWSPIADQILFVASTDDTDALSLINADGTDLHPLNPALGYGDFAWSPDGEQIVFASDDDGVSLINQDGSRLERLTKMGAYGVTWSPDGEHIAFVSSQDDQEFVYMINPDASELTQLTDDPGIRFTCLTWQPDSKQLIAVGIPDSGDFFDPATNIYSIQIDGSGETMPLTDETGMDVIPNCMGLFG
jgi:Tol biopolymer transport system component